VVEIREHGAHSPSCEDKVGSAFRKRDPGARWTAARNASRSAVSIGRRACHAASGDCEALRGLPWSRWACMPA